MTALRKFTTAHPLLVFVIAAYALSWWSIPFANGGILPQGPLFAAIIVLALTRGRTGLREYFRKLVTMPIRWYWFLVGPGLILAYLLLALGINLLLGAAITNTEHLGNLTQTILILLLLGGLWEETGWTGYALPLLQSRFSDQHLGQLKASLIMGFIRAGWHIPLVISGAIPWYDAVFFSLAFQFLITWLFNQSKGSVLVVMLFHLANNVLSGGIMIPLFSGDEHTRYYVLLIATAWVLALFLVRRNNWSMGKREQDM